jgi:hypothetical protein
MAELVVATAALQSDTTYQDRLLVRQHWLHRLQKWDMLQRLLGGTIDFSDKAMKGPLLKEALVVRLGSNNGFFAETWKDVRPTPKHYFASTSDAFVELFSFCGFGDEEPMEHAHPEITVMWNRFKHSSDKGGAAKSVMRMVHLRCIFHILDIGRTESQRERKAKADTRKAAMHGLSHKRKRAQGVRAKQRAKGSGKGKGKGIGGSRSPRKVVFVK